MTFIKSVTAIALLSISHISMAKLYIVPAQSELSFSSIKQESIIETNMINDIRGFIDDNGQATVYLMLDSVNTKIDIRDERIKEHVFETNLYPFAEIKADTSTVDLPKKEGESLKHQLPITIEMHGTTLKKMASVMVTFTNGQYQVATIADINVEASEFNLSSGIDTLQTLAKLSHISHSVPVNFNLTFQK